MRDGLRDLVIYVRVHGRGKKCAASVPAETRQTVGKCWNVLMKQPELGATTRGYNELAVMIKAALLPDEEEGGKKELIQ